MRLAALLDETMPLPASALIPRGAWWLAIRGEAAERTAQTRVTSCLAVVVFAEAEARDRDGADVCDDDDDYEPDPACVRFPAGLGGAP